MNEIIFGHNFFQYRGLKIVYEEESIKHTPYLKTTRLVVKGYLNSKLEFTKILSDNDGDDDAKTIIAELIKMHYCGVDQLTGEVGTVFNHFIDAVSRLLGISYSHLITDENDCEVVSFHFVGRDYNRESIFAVEREIYATVGYQYKDREMRQIKLVRKTIYKYQDELQKKSLREEVIVEINAGLDLGDGKLIAGLFHEYLD